ncbi:MAG: SLC13 family permease, partial [Phycisphaerales bacterium]|nr:SLC13 family permease [Phycisphaerales bacterium]
RIIGRPGNVRTAITRLTSPVLALSGFMNNTPLVAMFMPAATDLARKIRASPSRLLMPLSFASILGGQLTLVGTASNLVVDGLYVDWITSRTVEVTALGQAIPSEWLIDGGMRFFAPAAAGLVAAILGFFYLVFVSPLVLPERTRSEKHRTSETGYDLQMVVTANSPLISRSIEQAGLRNLPGLFLSSIERSDRVLVAVGPEEILQEGDLLNFVGDAKAVRDLRRIPGLEPEDNQAAKVDAPVPVRRLIEAVVSPDAPFIGQSVRTSRFRTMYNAAIIAVRRQDAQLEGRIGDIVLRPGDTLLLETNASFSETQGREGAFYLVSTVEGSQPPRHERGWIAITVLACMIAGLVSGLVSPVLVAWLAALAMVGFRCTNAAVGRRSIDWSVLVTIGAAIGVGSAISDSGLGALLAQGLIDGAHALGGGGHLALASIVLGTMIVSQVATNYGGAVIVFPIAMSTAIGLNVSPLPFMLGVMAGAGSNFMTPLAYQTNLMVFGPGNYRFSDYARLGLGLQVIVLVTATIMLPLVFPF